jgi:AraC family transcriptional regulator, regulatory protein of adaptative response / DNA-3-methyladenine glycosylase II
MGGVGAPTATVELPFQPPLAAEALVGWFAARAVRGVVEIEGSTIRRTLALSGGPGRIALAVEGDAVVASVQTTRPTDVTEAIDRVRRMLDLDVDPSIVDRHLERDPALAPLVRSRPGLRVPGSVDPHETAVLAVIGQQISTAAARTIAGRLVERVGRRSPFDGPGPARLFPTAAEVADADLTGIGMPTRRAAAVRAMAAALADGRLHLGAGCDAAEARALLLEVPGIGPWTADYIALRALGDRDALPATDLVLRQRAAARGLDLATAGRAWQPWRAYAAQHLWVAGR